MKKAASLFAVGISTLLLTTSQAKAQTTKIDEQLPNNYEPKIPQDDLGQITNVNSLRVLPLQIGLMKP